MSVVPTGSIDIIKKPQFTEEATEGTLPLNDGASGTVFHSCGLVQSIGRDIEIENNKIRPLGSYDVAASVKLGETHTSEITFQPSNFELMKYGMNLPVSPGTTPPDPGMTLPNGTAGVSISILMSARINGAELYRIYKGLKFNGLTLEITRTGGCNVTMPFECTEITDWVAAPTFAPACTYATEPSTSVWSGITSGADPLKIGPTGALVAYDTPSFRAEFDLGTESFKPNGTIVTKYRKSFSRDITLTFSTLVYNNVLVGDLKNYTPVDVEYTIAPNKKLLFEDVRFGAYSAGIEGGSHDFALEEFSDCVPEGGLTITDTA